VFTLSVIIPVYGQIHLLLNCIDTLLRNATSPIDLILIDDCYPGFDLTKIKLPYPCRIARLDKNSGFAQACNAGAKAATGEILLFLNSDTEAHAGWQQPLLDVFSEEKVGIVGPKLVFPANFWCPYCHVYVPKEYVIKNGEYTVCPNHQNIAISEVDTIQSCGGWFDAGKGPFHRYLGWRADDPRVNIKEDVSWLTGAAMAIRKDIFLAAGGFDLAYERAYFEDVALCITIKNAKLRCIYQPNSVFTHFVAQSTSGNVTSEQFRKNALLFIGRHKDDITIDVPGALYVKYW
jgi:O-antigen biosynthesis protein